MSQTVAALNNLSRTLLDRLRMAGDSEARRANMDLMRSQQEYSLARNRAQDERQAMMDKFAMPGLELKYEQDKADLGAAQAPVSYSPLARQRTEDVYGTEDALGQDMVALRKNAEEQAVPLGKIFGSPDAIDMGLYTKKGQAPEEALIYEFGRIFNAVPKDGYYVKPDGSRVTSAEMYANRAKAGALLDLRMDVEKRYDKELLKLQDALAQAKTPEQLAQVRQAMAAVTDPMFRMEKLSEQRKRIAQYAPLLGGKLVEEKMKKIDADVEKAMAAIEARAKEDRDLAWDREKLLTEEGGRNKRTAMDIGSRERIASMPGKELELLQAIQKDPTLLESANKLSATKDRAASKGGFQKDSEFLSEALQVPIAEAANMIRRDKALGEIIRAYNNELETLDQWDEGYAVKKAALDRKYKIAEILGGYSGPTEAQVANPGTAVQLRYNPETGRLEPAQ